MSECEERGVLATAGRPWTDQEIIYAVGGDQNVALSCLRELVDKVVARRNQLGAIYCRRMVRDEERRQSNKSRQQKFRRNACITHPRENEKEDWDGRDRAGSGERGAGKEEKAGEGRGRGLPISEAQAVEWASMECIPADFAREVFHQQEARNWVDGAGQAVTSFRSYLKSRWSKVQKTKPKSETNRIQEDIPPKML